MAVEVKHLNANGVLFRPIGLMENDDIIREHAKMQSSYWPQAKFMIVDITNADGSDLTPSTMRHLANSDSVFLSKEPGAKIAIVCENIYLELMNELYRTFLGHSKGNVKIFEDFDSALEWTQLTSN